MKLFLSLALTVLSLLGILDAGYITYGEFSGQLPTCKPPFACRTVLDSQWSKVGPVPLAAFGLLYYATMLTLGLLSFMDVKVLSIGRLHVHVYSLIAVLGSMGLLFSMWLVFIMGVILKAWCLYCLLSAANCSMMFILSVNIFRNGKMDSNNDVIEDSYALHI